MNIFQVLINYVYAFFIDNTLKLYLYNQLFDISEECPNEKSPEINLKGKSTQLRDIITYDISKNDSKIILEEFKEEKSQIRKGSNGKLEDQKKSKLLKNQIRKVNNLGNNQKFNADIQNYISYKKIERNKIKIHFCENFAYLYFCRPKTLGKTFKLLQLVEDELSKKTDIISLLKNIDS